MSKQFENKNDVIDTIINLSEDNDIFYISKLEEIEDLINKNLHLFVDLNKIDEIAKKYAIPSINGVTGELLGATMSIMFKGALTKYLKGELNE